MTLYDLAIRNIAKTYSNPQTRVLDVGCGTGVSTAVFADSNLLVGLDVAKLVKDDSRRKIRYVLGDGFMLPFPNKTFDLVVSFDVIEHVDDDAAFVKEALRVVSDSGTLIIGTPNRRRISNRLRSLLGRAPQYPNCLGIDPNLGPILHLREYIPTDLIELVECVAPAIRVRIFGVLLGTYLRGKSVGILTVPAKLINLAHHLFVVISK